MRRVRSKWGLIGAAAALTVGSGLRSGIADQVTLMADRDNTLYETLDGSRSNGAGILMFVGRSGSTSGGQRKRGLMRFDVAGALPLGSTIQSATLSMWLINSAPGSGTRVVRLHRALSDWGEAGSDGLGSGDEAEVGDATWLHRYFPDEFWDSPGGDFAAAVSAETTVLTSGTFSWGSTVGMVADVQHWVDTPAENFGWLVRGDESVIQTAKAFGTHEVKGAPIFLPRLTIVFEPGAVVGDCDGDGDVDVVDFEVYADCVTGVGGSLGAGCACVDFDDDGDVDFHDAGAIQRAFTGR